MTPNELKAIREREALTQDAMAFKLGLRSGRSIRYYEAGTTPIPIPMQRLIAALFPNG